MGNEYQVALDKLSKCNQEHLLKYWNELTEDEQTNLYSEIMKINFDHLDSLTKLAQTSINLETKIDYERNRGLQIDRYYHMKPCELTEYELEGLKAISQSHVAVIVLAGGLSTRLSISYPKGMYSLDSLSCKSLFQLQAERILKLKQLASEKYPNSNGIRLPWYIMTSGHTHLSTVGFFKENNYFGLNQEEVVIFNQRMSPCLTFEDKVTLNTKGSIFQAPDGSGGLYKALWGNQILQDMAKKYGTKYVHVYGVENILTKMADPVFTGYCIKNNAKCAAKVNKLQRINVYCGIV